MFNFQRVFADEVRGEFFNRCPRAFGLALKGGLAPADDAGVGGHFDQAHPPAGIELFDFGDFHGGSPVGGFGRYGLCLAFCRVLWQMDKRGFASFDIAACDADWQTGEIIGDLTRKSNGREMGRDGKRVDFVKRSNLGHFCLHIAR